MTERSRFFDSVGGDRIYTSDAWAQIFGLFVRDGYMDNHLSELAVAETAPQSMGVNVGTGAAWVRGRSYENVDTVKTLAINANASGSARVDRVVVRLDYNARTITTVVKQGTPGAGAPALQRDTDVWELSLAQVAVANGAALITNAQITDERNNLALMGNALAPTVLSSFRVVASAAARDALADQFDGMTVYREDTDEVEVRANGVWGALNRPYELLASKMYAPASQVSASSVNNSPTLFAAGVANASIAAIAPSSGIIVVEFTGGFFQAPQYNGAKYIQIARGGVVKSRAKIGDENSQAQGVPIAIAARETGLTPGVSYQYDLQVLGTGTNNANLYAGPNHGEIVAKAWRG